jgi:hypothetical protein
MVTCYEPPENLPIVARRLCGVNYDQLISQLWPGEKLVGLYDRIFYQKAIYLESQYIFDVLEFQVKRGRILGYYAIPSGVLDETDNKLRNLQEEVRKLNNLLQEPHPGLSTWISALFNQGDKVLKLIEELKLERKD